MLARVMPPLSVVLLTLLASLPWGLPPESRFVLPLLPYVAIYYWIMKRVEWLPEWFAFLTGLALDVLSNGPIGFWSLMYLAGFALAVALRPFGQDSALARWLLAIVALAALAAAEWIVSSLYEFELADWRPLAWAVAAAGGAYPFVAAVLHALDPRPARQQNALFERGV